MVQLITIKPIWWHDVSNKFLNVIDTFSLVVKLKSIWILLALATQFNLEMHQLDVKKNLNGYLNENIYMELLEGLHISSNSNLVCKFNKSIYGLK
jgi:hypothetical protein